MAAQVCMYIHSLATLVSTSGQLLVNANTYIANHMAAAHMVKIRY